MKFRKSYYFHLPMIMKKRMATISNCRGDELNGFEYLLNFNKANVWIHQKFMKFKNE